MADAVERLNAALADRYRVERELGAGGMATVYLARDLRHDREVAIKVLRPDLGVAVGAERFLREITIAGHLQSPQILTLLDSGEADGLLYYVMPYVEGESLRNRLARGGAMPASDVLRTLRDVVDGLAHAHRHGVIHRDIKPENVMLAERHALLVDFGVAKAMSEAVGHHRLTTSGLSLGTPAYMAPEQAAGDPAMDHRADIYAVGVMAYEMLTGRPPFTGSPQAVLVAQISTKPEPLGKVQPDCPPALATLVMKCLEKEPSARFQEAEHLLDALEALATPPGGVMAPVFGRLGGTRRRWAALGVGALVVVAVVASAAVRERRRNWVRTAVIPEIEHQLRIHDWASGQDSAYALASRAAAILPDDPVISAFWPQISVKGVVESRPAGARVYRARFSDTTKWQLLGTTPTDSVRVPMSVARYRIKKVGYRPVDVLSWGPPSWFVIVLDSVGAPNAEMVHVPGGKFRGAMPGLDQIEPIALGEFRIDRWETTNQQYKAFVDAGGYLDRRFWDQPFIEGRDTLSWDAAIKRFRDRTGRPGPSTWEGGAPPAGSDDLPVGGVSWYEAAAFAKFAGKSLPTLYHWNAAAQIAAAPWIVPSSNLGSSGPAPVSEPRGMGWFGTFDMAGNVREWCQNAVGQKRYILGGAWADPGYAFTDAFAVDPFDRSPFNGIRLVKYLPDEPNLALAVQPLEPKLRDLMKEKPVPDAVLNTFLRLYDYDPTPLNAKIEARDTTPPDWVREKVSLDAAYGGERFVVHLFVPKRHRQPVAPIIFFPGSNALTTLSSDRLEEDLGFNVVDFMIRSGRAVIWPVYKSTFERRDSLKSDYGDESVFYRDHVVMWVKDLRRSVDYLATRPEVDINKLGYVGFSWGAFLSGLMAAVEPRIRVAVLYVAGLDPNVQRPETDPFNFLPRVRVPVLMVNGKLDHFYPIETSQRPLFNNLGTPPDRKRWVVYEGGHFAPREQFMKEALDWLDKYLGPVP